MYIGYLADRQELRFNCIKDIRAVKQLSILKTSVAIYLFIESSYVQPILDCPSVSSSRVSQSCVIKSDKPRVEDDQQIILVRNNSSSPTIRPGLANGFLSKPRVNRPAAAKPGRATPSPALKAPRGFITSRPQTGARREQTKLNGAGNPAGGASSDDQCPVPKIKQLEESYEHIPYYSKKKSPEQCKLGENVKEIVSKIKEDAGLVRAAKEACKNADVQKDINHLEEELAKGNYNPGIGRKPIGNGIIEHRGKNGGRVYIRESDSVIEILAKSGKKKTNQQFVINRLKQIYG